ncbi:unnamed protein product [Oreochromis niloticus]|nr:unnamed protein product [Mustela putorius furo]
MVNFLSKVEEKTQSQRNLLNHINQLHTSSDKSLKFLKQQPDSKLEKADILEMTVSILRRLQQQRQAADSAPVDKGYSRCAQEMVNFLSKVEVKTQSQRNLLNHINQLHTSSDKSLSEADFSPLSYTVQTSITKDNTVTSSLWRPW